MLKNALTVNKGLNMGHKEMVFEEVRGAYRRMLPEVKMKDLDEALEACYRWGMDATTLTKNSYVFLYPLGEPSLFKQPEEKKDEDVDLSSAS